MQPLIQPSFHLLGFSASVAASQTDSALTPYNDGFFSRGQSGILLPSEMEVFRSVGMGLGLTEYLLNVPSMRQISQPRYGTVNKALLAVDDAPILIQGDYAPTVMATEGVNYAVTTDATAGPNLTRVYAWVRNRFRPANKGRATTIKATASVTAVAGSWVGGSLTLSQDLPSGYYEIVGAAAFGTGLAAVRFRLPGATLAPGVLAQQAAGEFMLNNQRWGELGSFGSFQNSQLPTVEIDGTSGAITATIYIDIVKVG